LGSLFFSQKKKIEKMVGVACLKNLGSFLGMTQKKHSLSSFVVMPTN
jgi:hypothetical protein